MPQALTVAEATALEPICRRLIQAHRVLVTRSVTEIAHALGETARCWLDPAYAWRKRTVEALVAATGFSQPVVSAGLDALFSELTPERLHALLAAEFGDPRVLDTFRPARQPDAAHPILTRAFGPRLIVQICAGNVPAASLPSVFHGLLVKAACLVKVAKAEPVFVPHFVASLAEHHPWLADAVAPVYWPGGTAEVEREALGRADLVIAYGGDATIASLQAKTPPRTRFIAYGHRVSVGAIARECVADPDLADRFAFDVAMYDQAGCLSPHVIYVERGGACSPRDFAQNLADALARLAPILPKGGPPRYDHSLGHDATTDPTYSVIHQLRGEYELRELAGEPTVVFASPQSTDWTVIFSADPKFELSCLGRTIFVKALDDLDQLPHILKADRRLKGAWQAAAVEAPPGRRQALAGQLGRLGLNRVCRAGTLQHPPATWHHDGRPVLSELVTWTDLEP